MNSPMMTHSEELPILIIYLPYHFNYFKIFKSILLIPNHQIYTSIITRLLIQENNMTSHQEDSVGSYLHIENCLQYLLTPRPQMTFLPTIGSMLDLFLIVRRIQQKSISLKRTSNPTTTTYNKFRLVPA